MWYSDMATAISATTALKARARGAAVACASSNNPVALL
jgi:hypothetical protein